jgi:hypothetical protein
MTLIAERDGAALWFLYWMRKRWAMFRVYLGDEAVADVCWKVDRGRFCKSLNAWTLQPPDLHQWVTGELLKLSVNFLHEECGCELHGLRLVSTREDWEQKRKEIPDWDNWKQIWEVDLGRAGVGRIGEEFGFNALSPNGSMIGSYLTLTDAWRAFWYYRDDRAGEFRRW